jgi:hypothetical protein
MALTTVEGTYKDGKVELSERPAGAGDPARVLVTFLPAEVGPPGATDDREELRRRAFARMKQGVRLGGPPYPKRADLHDRFGG